MTTARSGGTPGQLQRMIAKLGVAEMSDADLLERYLTRRDEAAFEVLVWRHGTLVWNVCRRTLNEHDAEDAFQATFLTLVRKGHAVARSASIASWLYKVASRIAVAARVQTAKRTRREQLAQTTATAAPAPDGWHDIRPVIDAEINRLPDKYRSPFILCCLEGKTTNEAAQQLGCPPGTVGTRVAWARDRLRSRLTRRGLTLSATGFAALLTQNIAVASVTPSLPAATVTTCSLFTARAAISASIWTLSEGVLKAMLFAKLSSYAACAIVCCLLASAAVLWWPDFTDASAPPGGVAPGLPVAQGKSGPDKKAAPPENAAKQDPTASFQTIVVKGVGNLVITQADKDRVQMLGDANLAQWRVEKGVLHLEGVNDFRVDVKDLTRLERTIPGSIVIDKHQGKRLAVVLHSGCTATIKGSADELDLTIQGAGVFHGADFRVKQAAIRMTGPAQATVAATDKLTGLVSGPGRLEYVGSPRVEVTAAIPAEVRAMQNAPNRKEGDQLLPKEAKPIVVAKENPAAKPAVLKLSATVDGYTQATQFNTQKYPFKYKGVAQLDADQVQALGKPGEIAPDTVQALLGCLLWSKESDRLVKATLKSDGKKLTGHAEVLHNYGKQGSHTLKLQVEGTFDEGRLNLRAVEPSVTGSWSYGSGAMSLKGEASIQIDVERP